MSSLTKRLALIGGCNLQKQCQAARRARYAWPLLGYLVATGHHFLLRRSSQRESTRLGLCTQGRLHVKTFRLTGCVGAGFQGEGCRLVGEGSFTDPCLLAQDNITDKKIFYSLDYKYNGVRYQ